MEKTLFSKIIEGEIPAERLHEDEHCIVIKDINPQAPFHVLVIPKEPIASLSDAKENHAALLGHLMWQCGQMAEQAGLKGYRVVINNGRDAGQTVDHLHLHILAGRSLTWPPG